MKTSLRVRSEKLILVIGFPRFARDIQKTALLKPVVPQCELYRIDAGIGSGKTCVGDMFVARGECDGPLGIVEKLKAQSSMSQEIRGRGACRNVIICKQHSATQFQIRNHPGGRGKVPL